MTGSRAAQRYAKAVLGMAKDRNVAKEVHEDMNLIVQTIKSSNELRAVLKSPVVKESAKISSLKAIFKDVNPVTLGLFGILGDNNRLELLTLVASRYDELYNSMMGIQVAKVTTAVPLTPQLETKIQAKVKELTGNEAEIKNTIDASIIGGFILRVGDLQYNASVASQLTSIKRELQNNTYVSKI
ncbi:ATP synthase F1 subunit delta [Salinimicrobium sp. GXAS 041]|uniref:ATP synthase F1 subunit delta n=1 Tax=Salinimicrobium sp. GXAS 041 TaxID=3400806 RepID=UPI003C783172